MALRLLVGLGAFLPPFSLLLQQTVAQAWEISTHAPEEIPNLTNPRPTRSREVSDFCRNKSTL